MDKLKAPEYKTKRGRLALVAMMSGLALTACGGEDEPKTLQQVCAEELDAGEGKVVVDGRCDANPEAPVGIYGDPSQQGYAIGRAKTGAELSADCVTDGEYIQDAMGVGSKNWVQIDFAGSMNEFEIPEGITVGGGYAAYVPAVWVDGEDRLPAC